jgi:hypothetical protein
MKVRKVPIDFTHIEAPSVSLLISLIAMPIGRNTKSVGANSRYNGYAKKRPHCLVKSSIARAKIAGVIRYDSILGSMGIFHSKSLRRSHNQADTAGMR